jgi:ATP/maltotriose-dependent transcriptional regulator MalT
MKTPLNIAKITPPRLSQVLDRHRLIRRLEQNQDKKLILILGQAAQGKSTLAASYVQRSKILSAWINLSKEEADPVNLFQVLVQSLQYALPEVDLSVLSGYPGFSMGPREEIHLYRDWAHVIFDRVPVAIQIFLDGMDRLPADSPSLRFLQVLLENMPPESGFIILSRTVPSLEIQRMKMNREAVILNNKELAFTANEVRTFFRKTKGISFNSLQLKKIHQSSEGWIGGLILICEHLDRLPEEQRNGYIADITDAKFKKEVFQYFEEEVFSFQPAQIQELLVKSSIFEIVNPNLLHEFCTAENATEILQDFSRRNLFVVSFYEKQKGWLFRYHQLFRDFLEAKLALQLDNEAKLNLFFKAGSLLEQKGDLEESVKYYLEAQAYPRAAAVIERIGLGLLKLGRTSDLYRWLQTLPEDLIKNNAWLLFYLFMTRRFKDDFQENKFRLSKALDLFEKQQNKSGQILSLVHLSELLTFRGRDVFLLDDLFLKAEALLQSLSPLQHPYERTHLLMHLGMMYYYRNGDLQKGCRTLQQAYLLAKEVGDVIQQINILISFMQALAWLGEFSQADEIRSKIEPLIAQSVYPELRIFYLIISCQMSILKGDLKKAQEFCHLAQTEAEKHGINFFYHIILVNDCVLNIQLEQFKKAEEINELLLNSMAQIDNKIIHIDTFNSMGHNFYFRGDFQKAKNTIVQSLKTISLYRLPIEIQINIAKILMALISSHLQDDSKAEQELAEAIGRFRGMYWYLFWVQAHFAMALLKSRQAKTDEAVSHLRAGFEIAREKGYVHFFILKREDIVEICTLAIELQIKGAEEYAAHLLTTRFAERSGPAVERLLQHTKPKIRKKAKQIGQAIYRAGLSRIRIKTLGGFRVLQDDFPIEDKKWQGNQPKRLLKAIIAHGSEKVSKEVIIEELWPESQPEAVEKNFKVTLHRLRKALEPKTDRTLGYAYIQLKDKFISLDKDLCYVDVDEFVSFYEKGKNMGKKGDAKEALSLYEAAAKIYQGDFLKEDLYAPWADIKREELRIKYIDLLYKTAQLYESRRAANKAIACYKKVVQSDPVSEKAYQRLMTLYSNRGMRSAALKVYEECRQALQTGLDTEPDEVTTSIYRKVLEA